MIVRRIKESAHEVTLAEEMEFGRKSLFMVAEYEYRPLNRSREWIAQNSTKET